MDFPPMFQFALFHIIELILEIFMFHISRHSVLVQGFIGHFILYEVGQNICLHITMRLIIANFDRQHIVTKKQVVAAVQRLPYSHYSGIRAIRYDPYRTLATNLSFIQQKSYSQRAKGLYYHEQELSVIIIFQFRTMAQFYHILYHEIGHYVFLRVLTQEQRNQWFYTIRPSEKNCISDQAKQNSREDFAETYAYYCTVPSQLKILPNKATYFQDAVFSGKTLQPLYTVPQK